MLDEIVPGETLNTPAPEIVEGAPQGVEGESPTPESVPVSPEDSESKDSKTVPYERFKEVNEKSQRWEKIARDTLRRSLEAPAAAPAPVAPAAAPGDADYADPEITAAVERALAARDAAGAARSAQVEQDLLRIKMRGKYADWDEMEAEVFGAFGELADAKFDGEKMADFLYKAVKSKDGATVKAAVKEARDADKAKREARVSPGAGGGDAPRVSEERKLSDMTIEERDAYRREISRKARSTPLG